MVSERSSFEKRSIAVATRFLQSAVILDDQGYPEEKLKDVISKIPLPTPYTAGEFAEDELPSSAVVSATHGNNPIPTKTIVHAFAKQGIVCAILDPEEDPELCLTLHPDITILDWYIRDKTGERARSLLRQLIKHERGRFPHQVRLVLIYTTEQNLLDIREKLSELLKGIDNDTTPQEFGETGLTWEEWHFIVLAKPGTAVAENLSECEIDYKDLPDRVIREFTRAVGGLLPNVAIEGLAAVRRNTHRLLQRFSSDLDPAYLTHRALLPHPPDSEEHLVALLGSELTAILEDEGVGIISGADGLREWIETRNIKFPLRIGHDNLCLELQDSSELTSLLSEGIALNPYVAAPSLDESSREELVERVRRKLTKLLGGPSKISDAQFAELTIFRPHYGSVAPHLTLGTILWDQDKDEDSYWLCIQPRCDSVRLDASRPFLFVPLNRNSIFDVCKSRGEEKPLRLLRERKPYCVATYRFRPDKTGVVRARLQEEVYVFVTSSRKKLHYIGQLRDEIAQDIAHKIASRLSRVGVERSEWQRLSLPRYLRDT
jgi:hypothetical protein